MVNPLTGTKASDAFMQSVWQRKPALIRQALSTDEVAELLKPGAKRNCADAPLSPEAMRDLALNDEVESRLISRRGKRWSLTHGPFEAQDLPSDRKKGWTLLIQSVDHHLERASQLLHRFNFIPQARLDDLMISIASDQGGVGPHLDSYDVFLLQLSGSRRWTLGKPGNYEFQEDQPVKLVTSFEPWETHDLVAGDMLYVPPGWVHDGVALGPCATASIGFRSPNRAEFLSAWLSEQADRLYDQDKGVQYSDRQAAAKPQSWRKNPAAISDDLNLALADWIAQWRPDKKLNEDIIGRFLTEPKAHVWFDRPTDSTCRRFEGDAKRNGVKLHRKTRISFRKRTLFINGEAVAVPGKLPAQLKELANHRRLGSAACRVVWPELGADLQQWFDAGWVQIAT